MRRPNASGKPRGQAFRVAQALKAQRNGARSMHKQLKEARDAEVAEARAKREEKRRRKAENELKFASTQTIDPTKLKKMNKKQLRQVRRTKVNADGGVELAPVYG
jgi:rRNA-processing protein CGR1